MNRCVTYALLLSSVCLFGCPPRHVGPERPIDDQPMPVVIDRINNNCADFDFLLRGGGVSLDGKIVHDDGSSDRADLHGTLVYRKPRDLYLLLDHLVGQIEVGSNEHEFWVWQKFDPPTYWWGIHGGVYDEYNTALPLRPDQLIEVLGLSGLPTNTLGPSGPVFRVGPRWYELSFFKQRSDGQLLLDKVVCVDRYQPEVIAAIVFYTSDGKQSVRARLSDYKPIETTDILAPHRIEMTRVQRGDEIELTFSKMTRFENEAVTRKFSPSPLERGADGLGRVIRLDDVWLPEPIDEAAGGVEP